MSSEYTKADFAALAAGESDFQSVHNKVVHTLNELDGQLKSSLSAWSSDSQAQYAQAKAEWQTAADDMTRIMKSLGMVIGTAHTNYKQTEVSNAQMWA